MTRNGLKTDWDRFVESVKSRFGPSKYEDPQGALSKLLQLGTVEDYQWVFKKLMNRVTDIPEYLFISFYIYGLKLHLQKELLVSKPTTLGDTFAFTKITEAPLEGYTAILAGTATKTVADVTPQRQSVPCFGEDTCELLQGRQGEGSDQEALLSRSMRLDVPKFSGVDLDSWILASLSTFRYLIRLLING
nr:retrotransposon-related protein [Tanacetum cinerariifolium]